MRSSGGKKRRQKSQLPHTQSLARRLWELFSVLFRIGACTFGGGYAMLPFLERELAEKRGWVTSEELLDYFAIGQTTPGVIAVNVATFVGYKRAGTIGGLVGTLGMVTPSIIIITVIAAFISNFSEIAWVARALRGINVAVASLLTYALVNFAKKSVKTLLGMALFLLSFVLVFVCKVGTIWIIIGGCLVGIVLAAFRGEFAHSDGGDGK